VAENQAAWITIDADGLTLRIVARPGSTRRGILRVEPRGLVVALHAPPDKGRANDELIELLARSLRLPRSAITLLRGDTSRAKTIRIATSHPHEVAAALEALIPEST
jgi:uncharacterized protein (TIGR00251 family)